jgi:hypothetical protein
MSPKMSAAYPASVIATRAAILSSIGRVASLAVSAVWFLGQGAMAFAGTDQTGRPYEPPPPQPPPTLGDQVAAIEPLLIGIGIVALVIAAGAVIGRVGSRGGHRIAVVPPLIATAIGLYWGNLVAISRASASEFGVGLALGVGFLGTIAIVLAILGVAWIGRLAAGRATPLIKGTLIGAGVVVLAALLGFAWGPAVP